MKISSFIADVNDIEEFYNINKTKIPTLYMEYLKSIIIDKSLITESNAILVVMFVIDNKKYKIFHPPDKNCSFLTNETNDILIGSHSNFWFNQDANEFTDSNYNNFDKYYLNEIHSYFHKNYNCEINMGNKIDIVNTDEYNKYFTVSSSPDKENLLMEFMKPT